MEHNHLNKEVSETNTSSSTKWYEKKEEKKSEKQDLTTWSGYVKHLILGTKCYAFSEFFKDFSK